MGCYEILNISLLVLIDYFKLNMFHPALQLRVEILSFSSSHKHASQCDLVASPLTSVNKFLGTHAHIAIEQLLDNKTINCNNVSPT